MAEVIVAAATTHGPVPKQTKLPPLPGDQPFTFYFIVHGEEEQFMCEEIWIKKGKHKNKNKNKNKTHVGIGHFMGPIKFKCWV